MRRSLSVVAAVLAAAGLAVAGCSSSSSGSAGTSSAATSAEPATTSAGAATSAASSGAASAESPTDSPAASSSAGDDGSSAPASASATAPPSGSTGSTSAGDAAPTLPAPPAGPTDSFPITVDSALGSAVIKSAPQRVVTLGWGSTDAAIALGVYPVAIEEQTYGGDADKMLPWVHEALDKAGQPLPTLLPSANEGTVPVEDIVKAKPDLILAPYSGITADQFATLSKIAPVVAYPKLPWATDWNDVISITAKALGRSAGGQAILDTIDAYNAQVRAEHPEFAGKTFASVWDNPTDGGIYVYSKDDGRVQVMTELGLAIAPSVVSLYNGDGTFYFQLSYEKVDQLDSDILINYADDAKSAAAFETNASTKVIPAVKAGKVVSVVGPAEINAVSPPTALSYLYAMPGLVAKIAAVVG